MIDDHQADEAAPHQPRNRSSSESKLRRGKRHCPVGLAPLTKNAGRTRVIRSCARCRAHLSAAKRGLRCGATGSVWEGQRGAACQACGLHGPKGLVVDRG